MCRSVLCAYGASLLSTVGFRKHMGVVVATWVALVCVAWMSERLVADGHIASAKDAGILFAISYVGQELAHAMTREKTYQQSYMFDAGWTSTLLEHTYFLLPLCFATTFFIFIHLFLFSGARLNEQTQDDTNTTTQHRLGVRTQVL